MRSAPRRSSPASQRFSLINAFAQGTDYRALVCVFLAGGNDGNNMVVPTTTTEYNQYAAVRNASGLAIATRHTAADHAARHWQRVRPASEPRRAADLWTDREALGGVQRRAARAAADACGLPGRCAAAVSAVLAFRSGRAVADGDRRSRVGQTGWGGRTADRFDAALVRLSDDHGAVAAASSRAARATSPLSIAPAPTALNQVLVLNGFGTTADEVARRNSMEYLRTIDTGNALVGAASRTDTAGGRHRPDLQQRRHARRRASPTRRSATSCSRWRRSSSSTRRSPALGLNRQIFFCQLGGFDTHQGQVNTQASLLTQVSQAIKAFYDCDRRARRRASRSRRSRSRTSGARCSPRAPAPASSAPTTPGATTTSSSAARCAVATSMA